MYYDEQACDIWVMKVYGVNESWTKPFTLRQGEIGFIDVAQPFVYSRSGDKVLVDKNETMGIFFWHDLERQRVDNIVDGNRPEHGYDYKTIVYVDSLVSINA